MGIFRFEWKQYWKSAVIWAVSLGALSFIFTLMFADTVMNQMEDLKELLAANPFYAAMGLDPDTFFSILGLFGYLHGLLSIAGAVQAMNLGMTIISKEYMYNTADFLMTKPYGRMNILGQKVLAAVMALALTSIVYIACSIASVQTATPGDYDSKALILLCITFPLIQLLFFALGLLVAVIKSRIPNVLPISIATAFMMYCIGMGAEILESDALRCFSPFKYYNVTYLIEHHAYENGFLLLNIACILVFLVIAAVVYKRKDIKSL